MSGEGNTSARTRSSEADPRAQRVAARALTAASRKRCARGGLAVGAALAAGLLCASSCSRPAEVRIDEVLAVYEDAKTYDGLTIEYPLDGTLFPPELAPPSFRWTDSEPDCDTWVVLVRFAEQNEKMSFLVRSPQWTPEPDDWEQIKRNSLERCATVTVLGLRRADPRVIRSGSRITISTSRDEVGAPLFYREVNLPFIEAVKDPTRIRWRMGPISSMQPPPVVLENLLVCGNCHSFSASGAVLGMDVDYANDKGSYALVPVEKRIILATSDIITWSDFRREDKQPTFGLLSQVSPDGRYAVSTVKDRSVFVARPELAFSQLFFPIRGILAVYDRQTRRFQALPGADDPQYVQSNPTWSPDGRYIVFARAAAYHLRRDTGNVLLTKEECAEFLEEGKPFVFDLYRIPFNDGAGGQPEPLAGASGNGMSNFFAKYSPDGKWIVFCKARSYMLLQPDSELYIIPAEGGEARRLSCNTGRMNSWHSWSPNGKWLVFSSKANSDYTQLFLTHIDEHGSSSPPVVLSRMTAPDRAANIPEFVNVAPGAITEIRPQFVDDVSYVRAGDARLAAGNDVEGAIRHYRKALELNPHNAAAHSNLGGVLATQGKVEEGVAHLLEAMRLEPTEGSAYYNLGMLRYRQGRSAEAIHYLQSALRYRPEVGDAHRVLGTLLCAQGAVAEGAFHLAEAVRLDPADSAARYQLARVMAGVGRIEEAVAELRACLKVDPTDADALGLLGRLLYARGECRPAIGCLAQAVEQRPDDPELLEELAWMLAVAPQTSLRDGGRAVQYARRACELTGFRAFKPLDLLGVAYAAAGRFAEAIQAAEMAQALARAAGQEELAARIAERIELYRRNEPYEPPAASQPVPPDSAP